MNKTNQEKIDENYSKMMSTPKNVPVKLKGKTNHQIAREIADKIYKGITTLDIEVEILKALEAKDLQAKKFIDSIVELFRVTHKQEIKELIEAIPFQGRIEDAADFQNRLSEWKERKLNQLK